MASCRLELPEAASLLRDNRQQTQRIGAEFRAYLFDGPENTIRTLPKNGGASARHNAESQGECEHDRRARMTGLQRTSRLADDMRVGQRIALLLRCFLIALHKRLVEVLVALGFLLELAELHLRVIRRHRDLLLTRQIFGQRFLSRCGDVIVASIGLRDADEFLKQLRLEFRHRISKINDGYMVRAELALQIDHSFGGVEIFCAKLAYNRIGEGFRDRKIRLICVDYVLNAQISRFGFLCGRSLGDELTRHFVQLLFGNQRSLRLDQIMLSPEFLGCEIVFDGDAAKFLGALLQPGLRVARLVGAGT